jgi:hypothetical protein
MDNDAPANPIAQVTFDPSGTRTLIYNGDLSTPEGDAQDWVGFTSYNTLVIASVECLGSNLLKVDILDNTGFTGQTLACGQHITAVVVKPGTRYLVHLQATPSIGTLQYTNYTLTIKTGQLKSWQSELNTRRDILHARHIYGIGWSQILPTCG